MYGGHDLSLESRMVVGSPSLQDLAALVVAERRMMHHAYNGLGRLEAGGTTGGIDYNVFLESFLLHFRNILDFLSPRPRARATDVQSTQFVSTPPSATAVLTYRERIDKRLSHITAHRIGVGLSARAWNPAQMLREIEHVWDIYLAALDREHSDRRPWFESLTGDSPTPIPIPVGSFSVVAATTSPTHVTVISFPSSP